MLGSSCMPVFPLRLVTVACCWLIVAQISLLQTFELYFIAVCSYVCCDNAMALGMNIAAPPHPCSLSKNQNCDRLAIARLCSALS